MRAFEADYNQSKEFRTLNDILFNQSSIKLKFNRGDQVPHENVPDNVLYVFPIAETTTLVVERHCFQRASLCQLRFFGDSRELIFLKA
jgi:hypothetical protein